MKSSIENIKGIITAVFTPFDAEGKLNLKPIHKYLDYLISAGCDGFFIGGANGECFLQSVEERELFAEAVSTELGGDKSIILHVGSINPQDAYSLAKKAGKMNIDAISSVVPFYYGYTVKEIAEYYKKLIALSGLPLIVYYVPENTGIRINNKDFIDQIINLPGVAGIKYTHSDLFQLQLLVNGKKERSICSYGGFDQMGVGFLSMGADGLIGATFSLLPEVYVKMYAAFVAGDIARAMRFQRIANDFSVQVKLYSKSAYKAILGIRCVDVGKPRACWSEVNSMDIANLERIVERALAEIKDAEYNK